MNTKLTLKICLLLLTGFAINRLPSNILADPPTEATTKITVDKTLPVQGSVGVDFSHLYPIIDLGVTRESSEKFNSSTSGTEICYVQKSKDFCLSSSLSLAYRNF